MAYQNDNPHPAIGAEETTFVDNSCETNCVEQYIPKHLRSSPIFEKINQLMCHYDTAWTDTEMKLYLTEIEDFYRSSLGSESIILNWYSLINWIQASSYNWNDELTTSGFESDFYTKYSLSTKDIWLSLSTANDEDFDEDGYNYYGHMLEPYVGSSLIQKKLLEKVRGLDGEVIDWYKNGNITNAYSFQFTEFPGWEKAKILIIGSKLLKNAESILISLKDENCPNRFILSHSHLDTDYLSDITSLQFEGVNICFQRFKSNELENFLGLFNVDKLYTKEHRKLVNYFVIRRLSETLKLDDLVENRIYSTRTPEGPGKFVQLMPAWMPWENKWSPGVTWEDHYDWKSIVIDNLVRIHVDKERPTLYWSDVDVWGRWIGWQGDPDDWSYEKPGITRIPYFEENNFIPDFGPLSGRSFYKPLIFSNKIRDFDQGSNSESVKSNIIKFWFDDDRMSSTLIMDDIRLKVVYSQKTREDTSNYVQENVTPYDLNVDGFNSSEHSNDELVNFWSEQILSDTLELDGDFTRNTFTKVTRET